jgi:hypothetical protein
MKENNYIVVNCSESNKKCVTPDYIVVNHSESNEKRETEAGNNNASYYGYWDF